MARNQTRDKRPNGKRQKNGKNDLVAIRDVAPLFRVVPNMDHKFVRTWDYGILLLASADQGYGFQFTFDSFTGYTDFTTLYDLYRIDAIEVIWELTPVTVTTKSSNIMPVMLAYPDYDDSIAPATLLVADQVSQMERLVLSEARPSVRRMFRPRTNLGSNTTGTSLQSPWIDMAQTGVVHYGIKFWGKNLSLGSSASTGATVSMTFRMHCTCRNPR